jgi:hypothetical protein
MDIDAVRVLFFLHVLANDFTPDVVRAVGDGGCQNARGVGAENGFLVDQPLVVGVGSVVVDCLPLLKGG